MRFSKYVTIYLDCYSITGLRDCQYAERPIHTEPENGFAVSKETK